MALESTPALSGSKFLRGFTAKTLSVHGLKDKKCFPLPSVSQPSLLIAEIKQLKRRKAFDRGMWCYALFSSANIIIIPFIAFKWFEILKMIRYALCTNKTCQYDIITFFVVQASTFSVCRYSCAEVKNIYPEIYISFLSTSALQTQR